MNNERINNSKTLSQYIEHHSWKYVQNSDMMLDFYAKDIKCDLLKDRKILYYYGNILILDDYTIYETAFTSDKVYSNGQQYKQIQTDFETARMQIQNGTPYFISNDNKYYKINQGEKSIEEISLDRTNVFTITVLKDETIERLVGSNYDTEDILNDYIVIKNDGQVYIQVYESKYNTAINRNEYTLTNETIILSKEEYGNIKNIMYSYFNDEGYMITQIVSDKGLYYLKQTNEQQYIDTEPTYEMVLSDIYNKYKKDILYMNCDFVFTTDNNIIRTNILCGDIDKEVK